jgi:hypothetical protein
VPQYLRAVPYFARRFFPTKKKHKKKVTLSRKGLSKIGSKQLVTHRRVHRNVIADLNTGALEKEILPGYEPAHCGSEA